MDTHEASGVGRASAVAVAITLLAGCAHHPPPAQFTTSAPFSRTFTGSGDVVCWSVKRSLLSQGYMLDRPGESGVLTGSRDAQPSPKLNVTTRLQTTCADNRNGTSIVFVSATREENKLQKMKQTTSVGVGPATLTMPAGSAQVLGTVRRETIKDPDFYNQFFGLVQNYADQERVSQAAQPGDSSGGQRPARLSDELPPASSPTGSSSTDKGRASRNQAPAGDPPPSPHQ
jgi:Uncharacterized protein conserved in bacteria (DUF2242)